MQLSTVTNMFKDREDGSKIPLEEAMRRCREIGFTVQDVSVSSSKEDKNFALNGNDWERWIDDIGDLMAKLGIRFDSAHMPFFSVDDPAFIDPERRAFVERAKFRSITACGRWGVKWVVEHVTNSKEDNGFFPEIKRKSLEYFSRYLEAAAKVNIGIAFENMPPAQKNVRYLAAVHELVDFVDSIKSPNAGICWDFGHANMVYADQCRALREVGKRLKATHVQDNWGVSDSHMVPFCGTIKWAPIMKTLTEIGYEGNFTFELGNYNSRKPDYIQTIQALHAFKIGEYLLSLA